MARYGNDFDNYNYNYNNNNYNRGTGRYRGEGSLNRGRGPFGSRGYGSGWGRESTNREGFGGMSRGGLYRDENLGMREDAGLYEDRSELGYDTRRGYEGSEFGYNTRRGYEDDEFGYNTRREYEDDDVGYRSVRRPYANEGYRGGEGFDEYNLDRNYRGSRYMNDYDSDYNLSDRDMYDRDYKTRWQTDFGDPFGDRQAHTPIRVIRGDYRNASRYDDFDYGNRQYGAGGYRYRPTYDAYESGSYGRRNYGDSSFSMGGGYDYNYRPLGDYARRYNRNF